MRILAIDTALEACAVAVLDTEHDVVKESLPMARGHAEALMPLVAEVMDRAKVRFNALDRIAVTTGPGSFTGLRVGISAARGIALATGKPAVSVTTLTALAAPLLDGNDSSAVAVVIDARHSHVYMQLFATGGRSLIAPRIASLSEAARLAANVPVRIVGSAAKAVAAAWPAQEAPPLLVQETTAPDIVWVARLGSAASDTGDGPKPLYLRAPDAQPQDAARLPRR